MAGKGGARPGAGNPGYGKLQFLKTKVEELSPVWFVEVEAMLTGKNAANKRLAIQEINKLQIKMIPQELTGAEGGPLTVQLVQYANAPAQVRTPKVSAPAATSV